MFANSIIKHSNLEMFYNRVFELFRCFILEFSNLTMFYNGVFELFECFIIEFANKRSDFRAEIGCFILEFSCISMHVISLLHLTFVLF